ncbi:MAG: aminopeptidase P N-terminal domain-containing protein [Planctomycetes bacterium]|nr:aminopeptidase P N-terminal domain-containing protein [Planctomycetota bacterium]MCB9872349.1 aminopeptidase P N-terminal domain-containing protein [Planctomycetota bacterium]MCB9888935.1 aminopeptidase P N-terminal domain-containing protein [Planctomycetota bacterium]
MYAKRRQRLLNRLGDGMLILPTAPHAIRNGDVHYSFRAGSDLHYLTGFDEPNSLLVAWRTGAATHRSVLFVPPRDRAREIWDGPRAGVRGAVKQFGVDEAFAIEQLWEKLGELLGAHARVFHTLARDPAFDRRLLQVCAHNAAKQRRGNPPAHPVLEDPLPAIADLRLIKDADELARMAVAARITARGHCRAMQGAAPGMIEYEVQSLVETEFRNQGSARNGYDSIVASGPNACILHYVKNDRRIRRGELLLIDAGAEWEHYTADITRTFPVGGGFSEPQKAVYAAVLKAQKAAIRSVKEGATWDAPHKTCLRVLTRELIALGVLRGRPDSLLKKGACRTWFMHGTSHWLGMDVHDAGTYQEPDGKPLRLRAGMVLTVEPGLYFDRRDTSVPKELRGIGVRIEDDVVVEKRGPRVLTDGVPKEIREIEALCVGGG